MKLSRESFQEMEASETVYFHTLFYEFARYVFHVGTITDDMGSEWNSNLTKINMECHDA